MTAARRLGIAVVGAGAIGRAHAELIASQKDGVALAAIVDPVSSARDLAERLGTCWFGDCEALLKSARPDAAIVATPNATHLPLAREFLSRGLPVLVEKPVAATVADAEALAEASRSSGIPVLVGHHRRHNPIIRSARAMIAQGRLGKLINASVLASFLKPSDYFALEWRRRAGGGPVLINLIHEIDLVRHLCDEIASVQAVTSNAVRGFEVEDSAAVLLRLVNGALVTLTLSDAAPSPWCWDLIAREGANYPPQPLPVNSHFICGTEGALTLPRLEYWRYRGEAGWYKPLDVDIATHDRGDPYLAQLQHFCRVASGAEPPLVDAEDGTRTLRATLAVHEAARSGLPVALI